MLRWSKPPTILLYVTSAFEDLGMLPISWWSISRCLHSSQDLADLPGRLLEKWRGTSKWLLASDIVKAWTAHYSILSFLNCLADPMIPILGNRTWNHSLQGGLMSEQPTTMHGLSMIRDLGTCINWSQFQHYFSSQRNSIFTTCRWIPYSTSHVSRTVTWCSWWRLPTFVILISFGTWCWYLSPISEPNPQCLWQWWKRWWFVVLSSSSLLISDTYPQLRLLAPTSLKGANVCCRFCSAGVGKFWP